MDLLDLRLRACERNSMGFSYIYVLEELSYISFNQDIVV
jgi:hypothetical protein